MVIKKLPAILPYSCVAGRSLLFCAPMYIIRAGAAECVVIKRVRAIGEKRGGIV